MVMAAPAIATEVNNSDTEENLENITLLSTDKAFGVLFQKLKEKEHHSSLSHICYQAVELGLPAVVFYAIRFFKQKAELHDASFRQSFIKFKQSHLTNSNGKHPLVMKFEDSLGTDNLNDIFYKALFYACDEDQYKALFPGRNKEEIQDLTYFMEHGEVRSPLDKETHNNKIGLIMNLLMENKSN